MVRLDFSEVRIRQLSKQIPWEQIYYAVKCHVHLVRFFASLRMTKERLKSLAAPEDVGGEDYQREHEDDSDAVWPG